MRLQCVIIEFSGSVPKKAGSVPRQKMVLKRKIKLNY